MSRSPEVLTLSGVLIVLGMSDDVVPHRCSRCSFRSFESLSGVLVLFEVYQGFLLLLYSCRLSICSLFLSLSFCCSIFCRCFDLLFGVQKSSLCLSEGVLLPYSEL